MSAASPTTRQVLGTYRFFGCVLIVVLGFCLLALAPPKPVKRVAVAKAATPKSAKPLRGVTVILDPGHGGSDSGFARRGCREDALNYRFAATLGNLLKKQGASVVYTVRSQALKVKLTEGKSEPPLRIPRDAVLTGDGSPVHGTVDCLHRRAAFTRAFASKPGARRTFFISIHHDAYRSRRIAGGHVVYDQRCPKTPELARILSRRLFAAGLARLRSNGELSPKDARHLGVLNPTYNRLSESILLEVATLSNLDDRNKAMSRQWRWKTAHLVANAIQETIKD